MSSTTRTPGRIAGPFPGRQAGWRARHRRAPGAASPQLVPAQADDDEQRLHDDPAAHLQLSGSPVAERDRHLHHAGAETGGAVRHLDLEHVPAGPHTLERDVVERGAPPCLEAAREVVGRQPKDDPRERGPAARDQAPKDAPVRDAAARHVARSDDEVCLVGRDRRDQRRQDARVVRPVRIHLDGDRRTADRR
jgi:hypothetical protein